MMKLTDEQLAIKAQSGNKRALEILIDRYKPLVGAKCNRYFIAGGTKDDLIQEGTIGLFLAIKNFNVQKNDSFAAFASMCIKRRMVTALKSANRKKNIPLNNYVSLSPQNDDEGNSIAETIQASGMNPEENFLIAEKEHNVLLRLDKSLSDFEKLVLVEQLKGKSYEETAQKLNVNKKSVDNAVQRIRQKAERIKQ